MGELEAENKTEQRKMMEVEAALSESTAREKRDAAAIDRLKAELKAASAAAATAAAAAASTPTDEAEDKATDDFSAVVRKMEAEMEELKGRQEKAEADLEREKEKSREMEERYKRYLEKAKTVIKSLDPRKNEAAAAEKQQQQQQQTPAGSSTATVTAKQLAEQLTDGPTNLVTEV